MEAKSCPKQCFKDDMSRAHAAAHPTVADLLSPESRAKILAAALLLSDNSTFVERQHATSRRGAHVHEQTYADSVAASSARQMLKLLREATPLSAPERRCRDFAHRPPRKGHDGRGAPASAAATGVIGTSDVGGSTKRRKIDRHNAWTAVHVCGRLVSDADRAKYHQDMVCEEKRRKYSDLANAMTRARDGGTGVGTAFANLRTGCAGSVRSTSV